MSTLTLHAPRSSKAWAAVVTAWKRTVHFVKVFAEAFEEAQKQAVEAQRRYPFISLR